MATPRTEFKTKNGLTLPIMNLKGKEYLMATWRIVWFENENPFYKIENKFIVFDDEKATCQTCITILDKDGIETRKVDAIKTEHKKDFSDYAEKASTGSLSRALSYLGYGTSFSGDELNELVNEKGVVVNRLADAPIEPITTPEVTKPVEEVKKGFNRKPVDTVAKETTKKSWV